MSNSYGVDIPCYTVTFHGPMVRVHVEANDDSTKEWAVYRAAAHLLSHSGVTINGVSLSSILQNRSPRCEFTSTKVRHTDTHFVQLRRQPVSGSGRRRRAAK